MFLHVPLGLPVTLLSVSGGLGVRANLLNYLTISSKTNCFSALERLLQPQNGHCKSLQFTNGVCLPCPLGIIRKAFKKGLFDPNSGQITIFWWRLQGKKPGFQSSLM